MFRASSTSSLLKQSTASQEHYAFEDLENNNRDHLQQVNVNAHQGSEGVTHVDDDDDADSVDTGDNNGLPAFLTNHNSNSLSFIYNEDVKVLKEPTLHVSDWLNKEDSKVITITVTNPHLVPNKAGRRRSSTSSIQALFAGKQAVYVVSVEGLQAATDNEVRFVERTFKEFHLFRRVLRARFPGSCPPPLPPTRTLGANREEVVMKRSRMLQLFLQTVADHPFFRNDDVFELFVASSVSFKKSMSRFVGTPSEGTERWRQALRASPPPKEPTKLIATIRSELKLAEKKLQALKAAAKTEVEKAIARANSSTKMVEALDSWLNVERQATSPLAGNVLVDVDDGQSQYTSDVSLPDMLAPLSIKYANHASALLHEYGENQMESNVLDLTRFELATLASWAESLDIASSTEFTVQSLTEQLKMSQQSQSEFLKKDLEAAKAAQLRNHRGLLSVELLRFKQVRVLRAMRLKFSITKMHLEGAEAILSVWRGTADSALPAPPPLPVPAIVPESRRSSITRRVQLVPEAPAPPPTAAPVFDEEKLRELAFSVASKAVEESRTKALEEERAREAQRAALDETELHKECKSVSDVIDLFWIFVYFVISIHIFFVLVFVSRGYFKEAIPILALASLTFVAGFLVELVHR